MEPPRTLQQAVSYFSSFENCRAFMVSLRWPDGVVRCPQCRSNRVAWLASARLWKCYGTHPKAKFSLKTGTIFEGSPLGLDKWLPCVWLVVNEPRAATVPAVCRTLGVTPKTAWFLLHRIRLALPDSAAGINPPAAPSTR